MKDWRGFLGVVLCVVIVFLVEGCGSLGNMLGGFSDSSGNLKVIRYLDFEKGEIDVPKYNQKELLLITIVAPSSLDEKQVVIEVRNIEKNKVVFSKKILMFGGKSYNIKIDEQLSPGYYKCYILDPDDHKNMMMTSVFRIIE